MSNGSSRYHNHTCLACSQQYDCECEFSGAKTIPCLRCRQEMAKALPATRFEQSIGWKFRMVLLTPPAGAAFVYWALGPLEALITLFLGFVVGFWWFYKHYDKIIQKQAEKLADDLSTNSVERGSE